MKDREPKSEINKGYIMIVDKEGKVVDMPMRSTEGKVEDNLPPELLKDIKDFCRERYPEDEYEIIVR